MQWPPQPPLSRLLLPHPPDRPPGRLQPIQVAAPGRPYPTLRRFEDGEERWHALGLAGGTVVLLVVHTYPKDDRIRIIGARRATRKERRAYENGDL